MTGENMTHEGSGNMPLGGLSTSSGLTMSSQHIAPSDTGGQANLTRCNTRICHTEARLCYNRGHCVYNPGHYKQANSSRGVTSDQRGVTSHVTRSVDSDVTTTTHMTGSADQSLACCLTNSCHSPAYTTQPTLGQTQPAHPTQCHTNPAQPTQCHTNPAQPTQCHTNPAQPTQCHTNPAQLTQCQTNPAQLTQCQTNPIHKSPLTCRTCSENLLSPKFPTLLRPASSRLLTRPSSRLLTLVTMVMALSAGGVRGNGLGFLVPDMVESGRCAHPQIADVLDLQRFSGTWYQVEEEPNSYIDIKECIMIHYTWHGTHIEAVTRGWDQHGDLEVQKANISQVTPVDPTQPRPYLQVRTPHVPPVPYHIIKTDYVNFACVYSCFDFLGMKVEISSILSRTPVPTNASLAACYHSFHAMRIDLSRMGPVLQGDQCWYNEIHSPEGGHAMATSSLATPEGGSHRQGGSPPLVPTTPSITEARDELVPSPVAPKDLAQSITEARDELAPSPVAPKDLAQSITEARDELVPSPVAPKDLAQSITEARDELAPSPVAPGEDLVQSKTEARDELAPSPVAPGEDLVQSITETRDELAPSPVAPGEDLVQQLEDVLTLMIDQIQVVPEEVAAGKSSVTDGKNVQVVETTSQDPRASHITSGDTPGQPSRAPHTPRGKFKKRRKNRKRKKGCGRHHHGRGCTTTPPPTTTTTTTTLVDDQPAVRPDVQLVDSQPSYGDKPNTANTEDKDQGDLPPPPPPSATPAQCTCICDNASSAPATSGLLLLIILLCSSVWGR
ncbi:uncharacterized protein [Panulirus ornatus]|uniref:uncharacterized protein n=1 Tax=Panulirus ornatus TaxID=150431 RepID=UPI003A8BEDF5